MKPSPLKLLLVEDSPVLRERLVALVEELPGVELVGAAATGAEAIRLFERETPDAIVLDVGLPDLNGLAVLRHIRGQSATVAVMIYSGYEFPEMVECCELLGATGFFGKADNVGPLLATLQRLAEEKAATAERPDFALCGAAF